MMLISLVFSSLTGKLCTLVLLVTIGYWGIEQVYHWIYDILNMNITLSEATFYGKTFEKEKREAFKYLYTFTLKNGKMLLLYSQSKIKYESETKVNICFLKKSNIIVYYKALEEDKQT